MITTGRSGHAPMHLPATDGRHGAEDDAALRDILAQHQLHAPPVLRPHLIIGAQHDRPHPLPQVVLDELDGQLRQGGGERRAQARDAEADAVVALRGERGGGRGRRGVPEVRPRIEPTAAAAAAAGGGGGGVGLEEAGRARGDGDGKVEEGPPPNVQSGLGLGLLGLRRAFGEGDLIDDSGRQAGRQVSWVGDLVGQGQKQNKEKRDPQTPHAPVTPRAGGAGKSWPPPRGAGSAKC